MKNAAVMLQQIGLVAEGFDPGKIDGVAGKDTNAATAAWIAAQVAKEQPGGISATTATMNHLQLSRWKSAEIVAQARAAVSKIVNRILASRPRYEIVARETGVPWFVIACLHNMESGGSFACHLHEGSPLTGRTRCVPKGRPLDGIPPFTWEESAADALFFDSLDKVDWTGLGEMLYAMERYNGTGYLRYHPSVPSPYLWAGSSIEKPGKYTSDGKWAATAISGQIGCAVILKRLVAENIITLPG